MAQQNLAPPTQSTKRMSFVGAEQLRGSDTTKDQRFVNFMPEEVASTEGAGSGITKKVYIKTRPGLTSAYVLPNLVPRGMFFWEISGGHVMSVVGNSVYYENVFLANISTSTGPCGFTEYLDSTGTRFLILLDGINGYIFTTYNAVPTAIASPNFPSPHIPVPVFLDGYLFVGKAGSQDVYNSDLNAPANWTAGSYLSAEMYPDILVSLSKNNNYIYAIGADSIEYFYDNANATGTPLAKHQAAVQQFGTAAVGSVVQTDLEVFMIGKTSQGGLTVWSLSGFKADEISNTTIRFALDAEGPAITNASAYSIRVSGQKLYVITLTSRVLVYGVDTKRWTEWSFINTPQITCDSNMGYPYALVNNGVNTYIAKMDPTVFTDLGVTNTGTIVTNRYDFETIDRKRCNELVVIGDAVNNGVDTSLSIQWSDDDYLTWNTPVNLALSSGYSGIRRLGMFRRRSFKFTYSQPYPWRAEGIEITTDKGIN